MLVSTQTTSHHPVQLAPGFWETPSDSHPPAPHPDWILDVTLVLTMFSTYSLLIFCIEWHLSSWTWKEIKPP